MKQLSVFFVLLPFVCAVAGCTHTNCSEVAGQGLQAYKRQAYDRALEHYSMALECERRAEKKARLHYRRGLVWEKKMDPVKSLEDYTAALELNPELAQAYSHRGVVRAQMGDLELAALDFSRLIALEPQNPSAYNNRALVRRRMGDSERAVADYTRAIELNPTHAYTYFLRSYAYESVGLYDLAAADMWQYLKLSSKGDQAIKGPGSEEVRERIELLQKMARATRGVTKIAGIEIVERGLYRIGDPSAQTTTSGNDPDAQGLSVALIRSTDQVPPEVGTRFGFQYRIDGTPEGGPVKISVVVVFPEPGLKIPGKAFAIPDLRYHYKGRTGETAFFSYLLEHFWQVLEGQWSIELWCQGRRLAQQDFTVAAARD